MSKKERKKIEIISVEDVSQFGNLSHEDLMADSEKYERDQYRLRDHVQELEVLNPNVRTKEIVIRVTEKENELLNQVASELSVSRDLVLRILMKNIDKIFPNIKYNA